MRRWMIALCAATAFAPAARAAECVRAEPPPVASRPVKPAVPAKPPCLDAKGGCPGWEAYSHNDAIKAYNEKVGAYRLLAEAYVKALNAYVKASADYAQCEVKTLQ